MTITSNNKTKEKQDMIKGSKTEKEPCNRYFAFLFQLQTSGSCNMFGAVPFLMRKFPELDRANAEDTLLYWMDNYDRIEKKIKTNKKNPLEHRVLI